MNKDKLKIKLEALHELRAHIVEVGVCDKRTMQVIDIRIEALEDMIND